MTKKKSRKSVRASAEKVLPKNPKGLHNLGNTCFLNSTLQCVCRVFQLKDLILNFERNSVPVMLKQSNEKGDTKVMRFALNKQPHPLSEAYVTFVNELFGTENIRPSISPAILRAVLIKQYPRFDGFGQHDSHEVLRCLLDGLRQEELKMWHRGILNELKYTQQASEELKDEVRLWGKVTGLSTAVDRLFGGVLLTSLTCSECDNVIQHFEIFLDLSLPILDAEPEHTGKLNSNISSSAKPETVKKTKHELKKERKAKAKGGKRKDKKHQRGLNSSVEDADEESVVEKTPEATSHKKSKKKGKYSKNRVTSEEEDDADEIEVIEEGQDVTELGDGTDDPEEVTPFENGVLGGSQKRQIPTDSVQEEFDSCTDFERADEVTEDGGVEVTCNGEIQPSPVVVGAKDGQDCSPENILQEIKVEVNGIENGGTPHSGDSLSPSSLLSPSIGKMMPTIKVEQEDGTFAPSDEMITCKPSPIDDYQSAGEVADTEDNEGGGLSDSSAPPPPSSSDDSLARDLSTKLRISPAGTSALAVALPDEEWQAKSLSQEPIAVLSSPSSPSSVTDLERYLARFTAAERLCGSNQTTCEVCTKRSGGAKSIRRDSVKRDLIIRPPAVLTIHLKRFQQVGYRLQKCSKKVTFPLYLDMRPFCSRLSRLSMDEGQYRLFGVVEHSGHLRGGHYVCYVADDPSRTLPDPCFVPTLDKPDPWPMYLHHLVYQLRRGDRRVVNPSSSSPPHNLDGDQSAVGQSEEMDDGGRSWFYCSDAHVSTATLAQVLSSQPYVLFYERIR